MREQLLGRLIRFVGAPEPAGFDALADAVVDYQIAAIPAYAKLAAAAGYAGDGWRNAPLVPTEVFREIDCSPPSMATEAMFRTSGTTGTGKRGFRRVVDCTLYHLGMVSPFVDGVLRGDRQRRPWISLIPPMTQMPESSLAHMVDTLALELATQLVHPAHVDGLDVPALHGHLDRLIEDSQPAVILTTALALQVMVESLEVRPRVLPSGSCLMLTGGFKGAKSEISEEELIDRTARVLGLSRDRIVAEYGMTELTSQAYGMPFRAAPWLQVRVLDPMTLTELPRGECGLVAFFDLLNLDNVSAILSSDLGVMDSEGAFTLRGRVPGAPRRGCSLIADEWGMT